MKREQIEADIALTEQAITEARRTVEQIGARRRPLLLTNDAKGLDKLDREIAEQHQKEGRSIERLTLLRVELTRAKKADENAEIDALHARADQLRVIGETRILDYERAVSTVVEILRELTAIESVIESANHRLGDRRINSPGWIRRQPVTVVPARDEIIQTAEPGLYDGAGKSLDLNQRKPVSVTRHIPAEQSGGALPSPLHEVVYLPPGRWGGDGWLGSGKSYNCSPATTPAEVLRDSEEITSRLLAGAKA